MFYFSVKKLVLVSLVVCSATPFVTACQPNPNSSSNIEPMSPATQTQVIQSKTQPPKMATASDPTTTNTNRPANRSTQPNLVATDSKIELYFLQGSSVLSDAQRQNIIKAAYRDNNATTRYDVTGYYDNDASVELARQRADAVAEVLSGENNSNRGLLSSQNIRLHVMRRVTDTQADVSVEYN